jgi:hypothetical protein
MMAFDRKPSPPTLEPETVATLHECFVRAVARGNHTDELRELLCSAAREAKEKGIEAERLLILLKEIWYSIPAVTAASSAGSRTVLLQELISRCIQEYYAL